MLIRTPLEMYHGTDSDFTVYAKLNGVIFNLTGCSLYFQAKWRVTDADEDAISTITLTVVDASAGKALLSIPASDTASLPNEKLIVEYGIWLIDLGGKIHMLSCGPLTIHPSIAIDYTP